MNFKGIQIIYEDNHLIAVNKPCGTLVHSDKTGDKTLVDFVKYYIKAQYNKPGDVFLGVIHRLDRPVSGVVVFARTSKALIRMNRFLQERVVQKTYWAITRVQPDPLSGVIKHYIIKNKSTNKVNAYDLTNKGRKEAITNYDLIGRIGENCLLEVNPITGRPHQIRVQLAKIGCPIRGDLKYGFPLPNPDASIHLHCRSMAFKHPVTKELTKISAPPPDEQVWREFRGFY